MTKPYTGGCACGALRYEIAAEPMAGLHCQCIDCRRESGTGHGSHMAFPRAAAAITGTATRWDNKADSGNVKTSAFCPTCGSPVYTTFAAMPEMIAVRAASLDEPERFAPQFVTYAVRGLAWDNLDPALTKFEKMPTG
jgi:hypothetical protein